MIKEQVFLALPINFKDICLIYPPKNKEIALVGFNKFTQYINILTLSQEDLDDVYIKKEVKEIPTPFVYLLLCANDPNLATLIKEAFNFFCRCECFFLPENGQIILGPISEGRTLDSTNFFEFQNTIRTSIGMEEVKAPDPKMHPKIKAMRAKARERDRIKARQEAKKCSYATILLGCCCSNLGITPLNIGELSYAGMNALLRMNNQKNRYDLSISQLLAGADPKKVKPKEWLIDFDKY